MITRDVFLPFIISELKRRVSGKIFDLGIVRNRGNKARFPHRQCKLMVFCVWAEGKRRFSAIWSKCSSRSLPTTQNENQNIEIT
jgi:hypothetical protein